MAQARLDQNAGVGNQVGRSGVFLFEPFIVETDEEHDDPIDVLQGDIVDDPFGRIGVPLNSSHPDPKYTLATVLDYRIIEKLPPFHHRVEVIYQILDSGGIGIGRVFNGWTMRSGIRSKTRRMTYDLSATPKKIGHRLATYRNDDDPESDFTVRHADGTTTPVLLGEVDDSGIEVEVGDSILKLSTVCRSMTRSNIRRINQYRFHTNTNNWLGWGKYTMLISDIDIDERQTVDSQGALPRFEWPISVELSVNEDGWKLEEIASIYKDKQAGVVKSVLSTDGPHNEEFQLRKEVDFYSFFGVIPAPAPGSGI